MAYLQAQDQLRSVCYGRLIEGVLVVTRATAILFRDTIRDIAKESTERI